MKKLKFIPLLIIFLLFCGCSKKDNDNIDFFRVDIANETAIEYMTRIQKGDIEGSKDLLTNDLKMEKRDDSKNKISSFSFSSSNEMGSNSYVEILSINSDENNSICNLDKYILKVDKIKGKEYKISEIKIKNLNQVFRNEKEVRMLNLENGKNKTILNLEDLPINIKNNKENNNLSNIKIEKISINFSGDKVAFFIKNGENNFLVIEKFKENNEIDKFIYNELFLENISVENIIFTKEEDYIIFQYKDLKNNSERLKIYKVENGEEININLEEIFPSDKYTVKYYEELKSKLIIRVNKVKEAKGITQSLLGAYIIDLKDEDIDKL